MLADIWDRATTTQPLLPWPVVVVLAIAALAVTWSPGGYRVVRHLVTLVHEAGHATVAVLCGRRLQAVRLHADTSGLTVSRGRSRGPGMVATLAAGYPAPAALGLLAAFVLSRGYAAGLLWAAVAACGVMLLQVRNLYGLWVVLVTGTAVALASWWLPAVSLSWLAHLLVWVLLLAAPRSVVELQRQRRRGAARGSDADQLARISGVPAGVWVGLFWLACAAALMLGAALLLGRTV